MFLLQTFVALLLLSSSPFAAANLAHPPTDIPVSPDIETWDVLLWTGQRESKHPTLRARSTVLLPQGYDLRDLAHAHGLGTLLTFSNGNTWQTLDGKRLFLVPQEYSLGTPSTETEDDWDVMSPKDLKEYLALPDTPSYEEVMAQQEETQKRRSRKQTLVD